MRNSAERCVHPIDVEETAIERERAEEISRLADRIATDQRHRDSDAIRCLWRTGDVVRSLRDGVRTGAWRCSLDALACRLNVSVASLDDALRVAHAFPEKDRERLLRRFEEARAALMPSHLVVLARVTARQRARGIDILLSQTHSVRELRACLRRPFSGMASESIDKTIVTLDEGRTGA